MGIKNPGISGKDPGLGRKGHRWSGGAFMVSCTVTLKVLVTLTWSWICIPELKKNVRCHPLFCWLNSKCFPHLRCFPPAFQQNMLFAAECACCMRPIPASWFSLVSAADVITPTISRIWKYSWHAENAYSLMRRLLVKALCNISLSIGHFRLKTRVFSSGL